jgi:hypothetical protein
MKRILVQGTYPDESLSTQPDSGEIMARKIQAVF